MIKFSELESGHNYELFAMITELLEKEAKNGNPFLDVKLSDGDKEIVAKLFDHDLEGFGHKRGDLLQLSLNVSTYNGNPNYLIKSYRSATDEDEVSLDDFILSAPIPAKTMYDECLNIANEIKSRNNELGTIVETIYTENKDKLLYWSAAKSMHHNCYSGLLYHSWRMMKAAINLTKVYTSVDADMVIAGCMLHDVGKLVELDTDEFGVADYTVDGNLFGHLMIGAEIIRNYAKRLGIKGELVRNLAHIIASHHYNREWGAVAPPATSEAFMVSQIDMIDAKMYIYEKTEAELNPGEITQTPAFDGIRIYRSANKV